MNHGECQPRQDEEASDYMEALDRLVDTLNISYDEAIARLGPPPYDAYVTVTEKALQRKAHHHRFARGVLSIIQHYSGPQYGEEEGVGYPDGVPHYYRPFIPLSTKQQHLNKIGLDGVRSALREARSTSEAA